jgi:hypothetical protein
VPEVAEAIIARGTLKVDLGDHLEGEIASMTGQLDLEEQFDPVIGTFESPVVARGSARRTTDNDRSAPRRGRLGVVSALVTLVVLAVLAGGLYLARGRDLLPRWAATMVDRVVPPAHSPDPSATRSTKAKPARGKSAKTSPKTKAGAKTDVAEPPPAVEESVPPVEVSRADVVEVRKVFLAALRAKGIVRGDDATLDEQRAALKGYYLAGAWADAYHAAESAQRVLEGIEVDGRFVKRKLNRLRRRSARATGETSAQIELLIEEIEGLHADGESVTANTRLNDGLQLLRGESE